MDGDNNKMIPHERRERVAAIVHKDFHSLLKLESAKHGETVIKYTERIAKKPDMLDQIARDWKSQWMSKTKKVERRIGLDFP